MEQGRHFEGDFPVGSVQMQSARQATLTKRSPELGDTQQALLWEPSLSMLTLLDGGIAFIPGVSGGKPCA